MAEETNTQTQSGILFKTFPVGRLQCNCSIIGDPVTKQAVVIDPGGDSERILDAVKEMGLTVVQVVHTHAHFDHFMASGEIHEATGAPLGLHREDKFLWDMLDTQCSMFGILFHPVPEPHHFLEHEEELALSGVKGKCLHTPGHTPGSMSFSFEDAKLLIAGDTLFQGAIGRTDLWGGDYATIERSIKQELYTLDEATRVITGHGPSTTIGDEIRHNAFVRL